MLEQFRQAMEHRNLAAGTIHKRMSEVRAWLAYLDKVGVEWTAAHDGHLEEWLDGRPLGARARTASISHLHMFYAWAMRKRLAGHDPTVLTERPRLPKRLPRPIPEVSVDIALSAATGHVRTMVALMAWAGLRCCEVARLEWSDVDLAAGTLHIVGKGSSERVIGISSLLRAELAALDGTSGLIVGRAYTPCRVSQIVNAHLRACGIERHTAHAFRHRKLTRLCEQTRDLLAVQMYAGHASVATTQVYVKVAAARLQALSDIVD
jgi:site-specific recombinase XerD